MDSWIPDPTIRPRVALEWIPGFLTPNDDGIQESRNPGINSKAQIPVLPKIQSLRLNI